MEFIGSSFDDRPATDRALQATEAVGLSLLQPGLALAALQRLLRLGLPQLVVCRLPHPERLPPPFRSLLPCAKSLPGPSGTDSVSPTPPSFTAVHSVVAQTLGLIRGSDSNEL